MSSLAGRRLVIVDAHAHAFRAYYALDAMHAPDGLPTNALFGFAGLMRRLVVDDQPDFLAVVFDAPDDTRRTFRTTIYPPYKAHRPERPRELAAQIPYLRDITRSFGLATLEHAGFEADDLIASIVARAEEAGLDTTVQSSDKDLMQLVSERTVIWDAMRGKRYTTDAVIEKFGVPPRLIADYLALVGDTSDNVPGVPGIGPKTAAALLSAWGSLVGIYAALETLPPRERGRLEKYRAQAFLSLELTQLRRDVPLDELGVVAGIESFRLGAPDVPALERLGERLGFRGALRVPRGLRSHASGAASGAGAPGGDAQPGLREWPEQSSFAMDVPHPAGPDAVEVALPSAPPAPPAPTLPAVSAVQATEAAAPAAEAALPAAVNARVEVDAHEAPPLAPRLIGTLEAVRRLVLELAGVAHEPLGLALRRAPGGTGMLGIARQGAEFEVPLRPEGPSQGSLFGPAGLVEREVMALLAPLLTRGRALAFDDALTFGRAWLAAGGAREFGRVVHDAALARYLLEGATPNDLTAGAAATAALSEREAFSQRLAAAGLDRLYREVELPLVPALLAMEASGVACDPEALDEATRARVEGRVLRPTYHLTASRVGRLGVRLAPKCALPAAARTALRARPGRVLVQLELAQPELRALAHFSEDAALVADAAADDLHAGLTAAFDDALGLASRDVAKRVHFAVLYGLGPQRLARDCALRASEMKALVLTHRERHPAMCQWIATRVDETRRQGYAETLAGRRCPVPELFDQSPVQQRLGAALAAQAPVFGTAAELVKRFAGDLYARLTGGAGADARLVLALGDALYVDAAPEAAAEVARQAEESVAAVARAAGLRVPLMVRRQTFDAQAVAS